MAASTGLGVGYFRRVARARPLRGVDWRAAAVGLGLLFAVGYALSLALGHVIAGMQQDNVEFELNHTLAPRVASALRESDLEAPLTGARLDAVDAYVKGAVLGGDTVRVIVWNRNGDRIYSSDGAGEDGGELAAQAPDFEEALGGGTVSHVESEAVGSLSEGGGPTTIPVLESYVPLRLTDGAPIVGAFELYQDYTRPAAQANTLKRFVTWGLFGALLAAYGILMAFVQRSTRVIRRQHDALAEQAASLELLNRSLGRSEDRFRSLVTNASDVIFTVDRNGKVRYVSPSIESAWRIKPSDVISQDLGGLLDAPSRTVVKEAVRRVLGAPGGHASADFTVTTPSGPVEVQATITNLLDRDSVEGIVFNCRDVTERRRWETRLAYQAFHDALTGLPNRAGFMSSLQRMVESEVDGHHLVLYLFDADGFKGVNDSMGHPAGDALLCEIARRLRAALPGAVVARFGGDEFAAALLVRHEQEAISGIETVMAGFQEPFRFEGEAAPVSVSAGLAITSQDEPRSVSELMRAADVALYHVKSRGGGGYVQADHELEAAWSHRRTLEVDLQHAMERRQFRIVYQPIFRLRDGALAGAEALVRWIHPARGAILPGEFIPLAETSGVMPSIGSWVRRTAIHQVRDWLDTYGDLPDGFRMRLNLSGVELGDRELAGDVARVLESERVASDYIEMEVTESVLARDLRFAAEQLDRLRHMGVRVAIDDFGTGYSSLSYLWKLPADSLKLDRSFAADLMTHDKALAVGTAVFAMAARLGLEVVAEGIETEEQLRRMLALGCHLGQGYLLARPTDALRIGHAIERERSREMPRAS